MENILVTGKGDADIIRGKKELSTNIDAKVTITFSMKNLIDEKTLQEAYDGNLQECVESTIFHEGLFGVLELDSVNIVGVERMA